MSHGSYSTYTRGCRCLACTAAGMAYRRKGLPEGDPRHGTTNGYANWSCRCACCTAAATRDSRTTTLRRRSKAAS